MTWCYQIDIQGHQFIRPIPKVRDYLDKIARTVVGEMQSFGQEPQGLALVLSRRSAWGGSCRKSGSCHFKRPPATFSFLPATLRPSRPVSYHSLTFPCFLVTHTIISSSSIHYYRLAQDLARLATLCAFAINRLLRSRKCDRCDRRLPCAPTAKYTRAPTPSPERPSRNPADPSEQLDIQLTLWVPFSERWKSRSCRKTACRA